MKKSYRLGLVSVSFRQHSPREIIKAVSDVGLSCIEWGSDVHAPCDNVERLYEIAELQREYGIQCSSYGTYFRIGSTQIEEIDKYINAAKILGTDVLRLWCGDKNGAEMTEEEKNGLLAECLILAERAEKNGVTLCLECHRKTLTQDMPSAAWLMDAVNSDSFRMYWQPFQWQSGDENIKNARAMSPYARHLHVFNWRGEDMLPLSEAVEQWRKYLNEFSCPRTLLLEFMPSGSISELKDEAAALVRIVSEDI